MTPVRAAAHQTFSSLRIRNYRLYFIAQLISVSRHLDAERGPGLAGPRGLSGSGVDLGIVVGLQFLPMLLFGPVGGLVADRVNKRHLLYVTQSMREDCWPWSSGAWWSATSVQLWQVYLLATLLGVVNLFDNPARQTFVMEMVGRDDLPNAVSLNTVVMNASRVIGPAIGGRGDRRLRTRCLLLHQRGVLRRRAHRTVDDADGRAPSDRAGGPGQGPDP